jgi:HAMP domain-containing protein
MSIRVKILLGFLILSLMLFAAGALSVYELQSIGARVQRLLDDNYKSIDAAKKMTEALERQDSGILLLLSGNWEKGRTTIEPADEQFAAAFEVARNNVTIPGEKALVDQVEERYRLYKALWMEPVVGTRKEGSLQWYFQDVHPAFLDVKLAVEKLMSLNDQTLYRTASDLKNRAHRAIMPGIVAILGAIVFTVIFNFFLHIFLVRPIARIVEEVEHFTRTRQSQKIEVDTRDEIGRLARAVRELEIAFQKDTRLP